MSRGRGALERARADRGARRRRRRRGGRAAAPGLRGLADRVEALGGRLRAGQPRGRGDDAARRDPLRRIALTAAELLRSVTRALASLRRRARRRCRARCVRGDAGRAGVGRRHAVDPGAGRRRAADRDRASPTTTLLAAAESVGSQIALFGARAASLAARRRAMLDVAFDSVVTMDDRGVVLAANRAAERLFGYTAAEMVGRDGRRPDHPAVAARRAPARAGALPADRARTGRRAARGADRDARGRQRVPGRARRHAAGSVPARPVFYGYLRDLTARYVAEAALHRLADEQAALRRVATAVAAEHESARLFALVSGGGRAAARGADGAHVPLRRRRRGRGDHRRLGACGPSTCCRSARG